LESMLKIDGITKVYKLYDNTLDRLKEALSVTGKIYHKPFYALKNISFEVGKGECVGIIGQNGSGKSTLLKIVTGVLTPTEGEVTKKGRISALLELGAGFNSEFTGIENIYLNGTIMGYGKSEMDSKMDEICSFADIGDYIRQPVKTYSSGMNARLAFAVAINVDPEILIVDEALSVGDMTFQNKCYRKFNEFRDAGKTILFVTHDMNTVIKYCNRAIVLEKGIKVDEGPTRTMVDVYKKLLSDGFSKMSSTKNNSDTKKKNEKQIDISSDETTVWHEHLDVNPAALTYGDKTALIYDYGIFDKENALTQNINDGEMFTIRMRVKFLAEVEEPIFAFSIKDIKGTELTGTNTACENMITGKFMPGDCVEVSFCQRSNLPNRSYSLSLGCTKYEDQGLRVLHRLYDILLTETYNCKPTAGLYNPNSSVELTKISNDGSIG
jgi:teichoic acid transport system ATP-binding protein